MASSTYHQTKTQLSVLWGIRGRATYVCTKYTKLLVLVKNSGALPCHDLNWQDVNLHIPNSSFCFEAADHSWESCGHVCICYILIFFFVRSTCFRIESSGLQIHFDGLSTFILCVRELLKGCRCFQKRSAGSRHSTSRRNNHEVTKVSV